MLKRARIADTDIAVTTVAALQEFLDILAEKHDIRAFIGGGMPRDIYCREKPRDIDMYVSRNQYHDTWKVLFPTSKFPGFGKHILTNPEGPAYQHQMVEMQKENTFSGSGFNISPKLPINLIGIRYAAWAPMDRLDKVAERVIGKYDFGMCMAAITPSGLWLDDRFLKDVAQKTCTLYRSFGREFAVAHYERIKKKYPWPMVESPDLTNPDSVQHMLYDELPFLGA
jgi:hypothetical protein